jgi:hypothetical protein
LTTDRKPIKPILSHLTLAVLLSIVVSLNNQYFFLNNFFFSLSESPVRAGDYIAPLLDFAAEKVQMNSTFLQKNKFFFEDQ